jgi:hypothetical protein
MPPKFQGKLYCDESGAWFADIELKGRLPLAYKDGLTAFDNGRMAYFYAYSDEHVAHFLGF